MCVPFYILYANALELESEGDNPFLALSLSVPFWALIFTHDHVGHSLHVLL